MSSKPDPSPLESSNRPEHNRTDVHADSSADSAAGLYSGLKSETPRGVRNGLRAEVQPNPPRRNLPAPVAPLPDKSYPLPSLQRLPLYLRQLKIYSRMGKSMVSCTQIAKDLALISVQVRKDLAMTGISGRPKVGYNVQELIDNIESFLGWNEDHKGILVGTGSLGSAILGYPGFVEHGLKITAAFDSDPQKIGTEIRGRIVRSTAGMADYIRENNILIGIITVPQAGAQEVTDIMVNAGIRAIWNYSPALMSIPPHVVCESVKLSSSFAVLSRRLQDMLYLEKEAENKKSTEDKKASQDKGV